MANEIKIGLFGLHRGSSVNRETLVRRAQRAEELGFESLWVGDHIALPFGDSDPPDQPRLEALTALTFMAAVTTRVQLAVGVIILPQRQPVLLAKQISSIDTLSNGRVILGVGVGYVEPELKALGASLAERGPRTDEYIAAMRAIWGESTPEFNGEFVSFAGVISRPRPIQQPHPPIVIGGHSAAAYRRAIESGNGWYGFDLNLETTAAALKALQDGASRFNRPAGLGELEITITPLETVDLDIARRYAELGVHRLSVQPNTMDGTAIDDLIEHLGTRVIGRI